MCLIHFAVLQKWTQHCKVTTPSVSFTVFFNFCLFFRFLWLFQAERIFFLNFRVEIAIYVIDHSEIKTFSFCKWDNRSPMKLNNLSRGTAPISQNQICIILLSFLLYHITLYYESLISNMGTKMHVYKYHIFLRRRLCNVIQSQLFEHSYQYSDRKIWACVCVFQK